MLMGRQTRQQRRSQARRNVSEPRSRQFNWPRLAGIAIVLAFVALLATQLLGKNGSGASNALAKPIDGIQCGATEGIAYHEHAHLTLIDVGKPVRVPALLGTNAKCLYWVHTHDASGLIHMEAPQNVRPTLSTVVDIWGEPDQTVSRTQFFDTRATPKQTMRVYVNQRLYTGDPRKIVLLKHTTIAMELGPPFVAPRKFNFGTS